jgi:hypothetical protein
VAKQRNEHASVRGVQHPSSFRAKIDQAAARASNAGWPLDRPELEYHSRAPAAECLTVAIRGVAQFGSAHGSGP